MIGFRLWCYVVGATVLTDLARLVGVVVYRAGKWALARHEDSVRRARVLLARADSLRR